jgi:L-asparaginase
MASPPLNLPLVWPKTEKNHFSSEVIFAQLTGTALVQYSGVEKQTKRVDTLRKVVVFNTGGTISMQEAADGQGVGQADPRRLQTVITDTSATTVEMHHLMEKASPQLTLDDLYTFATEITAALARDEVAGVVLTHGTDTLEETAYFLHLTIDSNKPVVVTGAMRSHNEAGADGPRNLQQAIRVAAEPAAQGRGTLVVFHDEIHCAATVSKIHTTQPSTFQSPNTGPLGILSKQHVIFHHPPQQKARIPLVPPTAKVALVTAAVGMDDLLIRSAVAHGVDGLVIEALGQGNLPPTMLPSCQAALAEGVPIALVSRCSAGWVEAIYNYDGGGKQLDAQGFTFCPGLNGAKARIKLLLAISAQRALPGYQPFFV